jgi:hypothetical protein
MKDRGLFLTSDNGGPEYIVEAGKEVNKMEEKKMNKTEGKKESVLPMVILLIAIGIGMIVLVGSMLYSG